MQILNKQIYFESDYIIVNYVTGSDGNLRGMYFPTNK